MDREVDNDEIVESIIAVTLQLGMAVEKIVFDGTIINIHVKGKEKPVSVMRGCMIDRKLEDLRLAIQEETR